MLKKGDILNIGFTNLKAKIIKKIDNNFELLSISEGYLENNKGVHVENRWIKLKFITNKDEKCIKLGLNLGIKILHFPSPTRWLILKNFKKILPFQNKIFKIETNNAVKILTHSLKRIKFFNR